MIGFHFYYLIYMILKDWRKDSKLLDKHIGIEDEMQRKFKKKLDIKFRT